MDEDLKQVADLAEAWYKHGQCDRCGIQFWHSFEVFQHWPECTAQVEHLCINCFRKAAPEVASVIDNATKKEGQQ